MTIIVFYRVNMRGGSCLKSQQSESRFYFVCKNIFAKYFLQISPEQPQPTNLPPPPPEKKGLNLFIVTQGSLFFIFERIETPDFAMCAQLCQCATQSANRVIPPPWARWRIVCTTWWRRPSPPVPRGRRSSPMTEKYREKSRIHPSMLNLPGNHLRWRCHCRRAAQKWCAKACLGAPIWREKICNPSTK